MILNYILWYPSSKSKSLFEIAMKMGKMPDYVKKWQVLQTAEGKEGIKQYNIIHVEKNRGDDAIVEISKIMRPFIELDFVEAKLEVLIGVQDSRKIMA